MTWPCDVTTMGSSGNRVKTMECDGQKEHCVVAVHGCRTRFVELLTGRRATGPRMLSAKCTHLHGLHHDPC